MTAAFGASPGPILQSKPQDVQVRVLHAQACGILLAKRMEESQDLLTQLLKGDRMGTQNRKPERTVTREFTVPTKFLGFLLSAEGFPLWLYCIPCYATWPKIFRCAVRV